MPKKARPGRPALAGLVAKPGAAARPAPAAQAAPAGAPKALTVKLDPALYRRLRLHAAETDRTHQAIMAEALVEYLERRG